MQRTGLHALTHVWVGRPREKTRRKIFPAGVFLFSLILLGVERGRLAAAEAKFEEVAGTVEFQLLGETAWRTAAVGEVAPAGSMLKTGPLSGCKLTTPEGYSLRLRADTQLRLTRLGDDSRVDMKVGALRSKLGKLKTGSKYAVHTPAAVATIRGTLFDTIVSAVGRTIIQVFEGVVSLRDVQGIGKEIQLVQNQESVVEPGTPVRAPEPVRERLLPEEEPPAPPAEEEKGEEPAEGTKAPEGSPEAGASAQAEGAGQEEGLPPPPPGAPPPGFAEKPPGEGGPPGAPLGQREPGMAAEGPRPPGPGPEGMRMAKVEAMFARGISPGYSGERGPGMEEGPMDPEKMREGLRFEADRELRFEFNKEDFQQGFKEELRKGQYQESKTLIDAFGKRVRVEQYITRPTPESFKFITLNTREDRLDSGFIEVVANKPLPEDLSIATREMFFKPGDTPPEFTALKFRRFMTNETDNHAFIAVDGASKKIKIPGFRFDPATGLVQPADTTAFQTIFSHQYEFHKGDPTTMENIFGGSLRPGGDLSGNALGITQHIVPILVPLSGPSPATPDWSQTDLTAFSFHYVRTGNITSKESFFAPSGKDFAHFQRKVLYHTYTDGATGAKFFTPDSDGTTGGTRTDGTADSDASAVSDLINVSDADTTPVGTANPDFVTATPFLTAVFEERIITDEGKLFNFQSAFSKATDEIEGSDKRNLFERLNLELTLSVTNFTGPEKKIDLVFSPRLAIQTGLLDLDKKGFEPPPSP